MDTMFRCSTVFRVRLPTDTKPTGKQKQQVPSKGGRPRRSITQRRIVLWSLSEFGLLWRGPSNSTGIHTENKQRCLIATEALCRADSTQRFPGCSASSLRCSAWVGNCSLCNMPGGPAASVSSSGARCCWGQQEH